MRKNTLPKIQFGNQTLKAVGQWSYLPENIWCPVVHECSVRIQRLRHRHSGNLKVLLTNGPTNWWTDRGREPMWASWLRNSRLSLLSEFVASKDYKSGPRIDVVYSLLSLSTIGQVLRIGRRRKWKLVISAAYWYFHHPPICSRPPALLMPFPC